jgi:threonine synthase
MGDVIPSISPSMDIQISSNFERAMFDAYDRDGAAIAQVMNELKTNGGFALSQGVMDALRENFDSGRVSEAETSAEITHGLSTHAELLCPHSAIGTQVADRLRDANTPMITLATAHPAKFPDAVEAATGIRPPLPPRMSDLFERDERVTRVDNNLDALKAIVKDRIAN